VAKAVRVRVSPTAPNKSLPGPGDRPDLQKNGDQHFKMNLDQYLPCPLVHPGRHCGGRGPQVLGYILGPNRPDAAKNSPYECGFEAFEDARMKFDVRYYLVAILFILVRPRNRLPVSLGRGAQGNWRMSAFWAVMIFLGILVVGFVYEWKKGALDWE
jgi:NADH-quinone oxidoreductase subunit A